MTPEASNRPLAAALWAFAIAVGAAIALGLLSSLVPLVGRHVGVLVALVFLFVPVELAHRRGLSMADIGFTWAPVGKGLTYSLGTLAVVFPVFLFGFVWFYDLVCASESLSVLAPAGWCGRWRGLDGAAWPPLDWAFAEHAAAQVIAVAIPEELLFRGYIHGQCERAFPPRRRVLGGGVGLALVISSVLFALSHLAIGFDPRRLATFFPGLMFGWLRSATGSIAAPVIVHASANVFIRYLSNAFG